MAPLDNGDSHKLSQTLSVTTDGVEWLTGYLVIAENMHVSILGLWNKKVNKIQDSIAQISEAK